MERSVGFRGLVRLFAATVLLFAAMDLHAQIMFKSPQPGDVYKEYIRWNNNLSNDWRVTDPNTGNTSAQTYLPNATLSINIDDLTDAIRAEASLIVWGGHVGTSNKSISFNGNPSISIPELDTSNGLPVNNTSESDAVYGAEWMHESMITIDIPLNQLVQGSNTFQGSCGDQLGPYGFGWGQFGIYGIVIRVYYDPAKKAHPTGTITTPVSRGTIGENPTITASVGAGVTRVDFLAYYDGYDTDGDGKFVKYHHDYHYRKYDGAVSLKNHVGTATSAPWQTTWQTNLVPDQPLGGVKILARIQDNTGMWYVTPEVSQISLVRTGASVQIYKPQNVPIEFWTMYYSGATKSSNFTIPGGTNLADATTAALLVKTWNGDDEFGTAPADAPYNEYWTKLNGNTMPVLGIGHFYEYDTVLVSSGWLQTGQNTVEFHANSQKQHGIEVMWPGPAMTVRYAGAGYASPVAAAPTLVSPANGATSVPAPTALVWNSALTATGYRLQVSSNSGFTALVVDDSTLTDTTKTVSGLVNQTTYYWRVRTLSAAGGSQFSSSRSFTTLVSGPTLLSPPNTASSVPINARLSWSRIPGAPGYFVQVGTNQNFTSGVVYSDSTITDTTAVATGLSATTTYYWHVRMRDGGVGGPFSAVWSFTTSVAVAPAPSLLSPTNNAVDVSTTALLQWARSAGAATYRLQVATDQTFASGMVLNDSTIADTSRQVPGLANSTQYFWHVNAKNAGGTSAYSATYAFTTAAPGPNAPALNSPANLAMAQPTTINFNWSTVSGATAYHFQLATDSTFAGGFIKNDSTLSTNSRTVIGLTDYTKYFWRVRAKNAGGFGAFSSAWSFTTAMPLPAQVQLAGPVSGATVDRDTVVLSWHPSSPSVQRYYIDHALDAQFVFVGTDSTADTSVVVRQLQVNKTYYWRVYARNVGGVSPLSEVRTFNVVVADVPTANGVPKSFGLNQNYPNPFNPTTMISGQWPVTSVVRLAVYDVLGREVAVLAEGQYPAGNYTFAFNARGLSSGVYYYRLIAGTYTSTKAMLLQK